MNHTVYDHNANSHHLKNLKSRPVILFLNLNLDPLIGALNSRWGLFIINDLLMITKLTN
jgi:hypothetical protein